MPRETRRRVRVRVSVSFEVKCASGERASKRPPSSPEVSTNKRVIPASASSISREGYPAIPHESSSRRSAARHRAHVGARTARRRRSVGRPRFREWFRVRPGTAGTERPRRGPREARRDDAARPARPSPGVSTRRTREGETRGGLRRVSLPTIYSRWKDKDRQTDRPLSKNARNASIRFLVVRLFLESFVRPREPANAARWIFRFPRDQR